MERIKKIKLVLVFLTILLISLIAYISYFQLVESKKIVDNEYNQRNWVDEDKYIRGKIYSRNGEIIADNVVKDGKKLRYYPYGSLFSHAIGYSSKEYGKTGLEREYNDELINISKKTPIDNIKDIVIEEKKGNDIYTSLDIQLQKEANELLQGHKGSIVLLNPKTGEIYAMVSKPDFDPNNLSKDWENLITNDQSPLLNRAVNGLYTPGSIIKVITAISILENKDKINLLYDDTGSINVDGYTINNYMNQGHGQINLMWALVHSSNTYFVDKSLQLGPKILEDTFSRFMFGKGIPFDYPVESSTNPFVEGMNNLDLAAAAFGQGTTLVTPLNMALSIGAIANNGKMVIPTMINKIDRNEKDFVNEFKDNVLINSTSEEVSKELRDDLAEVVNNYDTATTYNVSSGGKTGTAETGSGFTHAWYLGFAPLEDPYLAVAVILEEDGSLGGTTAAPIGAKMLDLGYEVIK